MAWAEVGGIALRYRLDATGDRALVFANAMGATLESWDDLLSLWPPDRRCLRYDMRGTGLSQRIRADYVFEDAVADLRGLISRFVDAPFVLIGAALGAAVALRLAADWSSGPPGLPGLQGVVALAPVTGTSEAGRTRLRERAQRIEREGIAGWLDEDILPNAYPQVLRADRGRFERFRLRHLSNDGASYAATQRMVTTIELAAHLPRVRVPMLVVAGSLDRARTPEATRLAFAGAPAAEHVTLASGHFMATQSPELVAPLLQGFLDRLPPGGTLAP